MNQKNLKYDSNLTQEAKEFYDYILITKYYFSSSECDRIVAFKNSFQEKLQTIHKIQNENNIKAIIEQGNIMPAYCGFAISHLIEYDDPDCLYNAIVDIQKIYIQYQETDPDSQITKDLLETFLSFFLFIPKKTCRTLLINHYDAILSIVDIAKARSSVILNIINGISELYLLKKDERYVKDVVDIFEKFIKRVQEGEGSLSEVKNVISLTFKETVQIVKEYVSVATKKSNIKTLSIIVGRKIDLGQLFYAWIFINPSVASNLINSNLFSQNLINILINQTKLIQVLEIYLSLKNNISEDKSNAIVKYIKENYNLMENEIIPKLSSLSESKEVLTYAIFARQLEINKEDSFTLDYDTLLNKISLLNNNLTAHISNKTLSITVAHISKSAFVNDLVNKFSGAGDENSYIKKLQEKDIIKKIKESNVSAFILDQISFDINLTILYLIKKIKNQSKDISLDELKKNIYIKMVKEYNFVFKKNYSDKIVDLFF